MTAVNAVADTARQAQFEQETGGLRRELLAHCYRMTGSAADAEDLVQETYLRAWRGWADFDHRASTRTWMYRIATNACLNALGAAARRVLPSGLGGPPGDPTAPLHEDSVTAWLEPLPDAMLWTSAQPTPEERLLARENVTLAWAAALQNLTPQQRAVLLLRDVLGLSAAETAETLDTSVAAVNSTLQRGRAAVGDGLGEGDEPADPQLEDRAVAAFVDAFERHDFDALVAALAPGARWQMPPFDRWYSGGHAAAVLSWTHCPARAAGDLRLAPTPSNGAPAIGMYLLKGRRFEAFQFMVLHADATGRVDDVVGFFDPHLFRLAGLPLGLDS